MIDVRITREGRDFVARQTRGGPPGIEGRSSVSVAAALRDLAAAWDVEAQLAGGGLNSRPRPAQRFSRP